MIAPLVSLLAYGVILLGTVWYLGRAEDDDA